MTSRLSAATQQRLRYVKHLIGVIVVLVAAVVKDDASDSQYGHNWTGRERLSRRSSVRLELHIGTLLDVLFIQPVEVVEEAGPVPDVSLPQSRQYPSKHSVKAAS